MSTYVSLGSRLGSVNTGQVAADNTGNNTGNWTVQFTPDDINCNVPFFEISHIVVNGAPGAAFNLWIDLMQWDTNQIGDSNSWDPAVPVPLKPGQYVYFYYSTPTNQAAPTVTLWLRYDIDIPANKAVLLGMPAQ